MRWIAVLIATTALAGLGVASAEGYPPRQTCQLDYGTDSIDSPMPVTALTWSANLDLSGTLACNFQPAVASHMKLHLDLTGCSTAAGWGTIDLVIGGFSASTAFDFALRGPNAELEILTPPSTGEFSATPAGNLLGGTCFTGVRLQGVLLYNQFAGTSLGG